MKRFFRWWFAELQSLVPARFKDLSSSLRMGFDVKDSQVQVGYGRGTKLKNMGTYELPDESASTQTPSGFVVPAGVDPKRTTCEVTVHDGVLRRDVELPAAAAANLRTVLGYQMARFTPFEADDVYFKYRRLAGESGDDKLRVRLWAAPRHIVDGALSPVHGWRLNPVRGSSAPGEDEPLKQSFRSTGYSPSVWARLNWALVGVNVLIAVAILSLPMIRQHKIVSHLEDELWSARKAAAAVAETEEQITLARQKSDDLIGYASEHVTVLSILHNLTQAMADGSWLEVVELERNALTVQGYTPSVRETLRRLEAQSTFNSARIDGPFEFKPELSAYNFRLEMQVRKEEISELVQQAAAQEVVDQEAIEMLDNEAQEDPGAWISGVAAPADSVSHADVPSAPDPALSGNN